MKSKLKIKGLDCANCAIKLERAVEKIDGIESCNINFMREKMEIEYDDTKKDEILKTMKKVISKEEPDVNLEEI